MRDIYIEPSSDGDLLGKNEITNWNFANSSLWHWKFTQGAVIPIAMLCRTRLYIGELCGSLVLRASLDSDRVRNTG